MHKSTPAKLLLTGFDPFDRFTINPSWESAHLCAQKYEPGVVAARLSVDYHLARKQVIDLLLLHRPTACLCMGLAPTPEFRLEIHARKPVQFDNIPGEVMLSGHWPITQLEHSLQRAEVSYRQSTDAGRYVCESTYWTLLDFRAQHGWPATAFFLHVPCVSDVFPVERIVGVVQSVVSDFIATAS